jgi:GxxExxY protein
MEINQLSGSIIDAAVKIHMQLGPGLLESVYEQCMAIEFQQRGIRCASQIPLPIVYAGHRIESAYRLDLLVDDRIIVEIKAIEHILPVHKAQLLSYLRLTEKKLGLLLNFNVPRMREGIYRIVNSLYSDVPDTLPV